MRILIALALILGNQACGTTSATGANSGPTTKAQLIAAAEHAYTTGSFADLAKLHLAPDLAACAADPHFAARLQRAHTKSEEKYPKCQALGIGKTKVVRVRHHPYTGKVHALHGCKAFQRIGDVQVYYESADGSRAYVYLDDVVKDAKGRLWLGDDAWCRKVVPLPRLLMGALNDQADEGCACKDAACFAANRGQEDSAIKLALTLILSKGLDDEAFHKVYDRWMACGKQLGARFPYN